MNRGKKEGNKTPRRGRGQKKPTEPGENEIVLAGGTRPPGPPDPETSGQSPSEGKGPIEPKGESGLAASYDEVFRDIVKKAREGDIKYQELYLRYIDLISQKTNDGDEVIYEATFIDEKKDKET